MNRRVLTYVVIALIVGAALALAVAVAQSSPGGASVAGAPAGGDPGATAIYSEESGATLAAVDPAKEQPLLDRFTSKDPFIQFPAPASAAGDDGSEPDPSASGTPAATNLSARISVDGTAYNVSQGDKVPGGAAAKFNVTGISSSDVTFGVIDGKLENGESSFKVNLGETVEVTLDSGDSYKIKVNSISEAGSSGSGGGSSGTLGSGHSISLLSVSSQNGSALATFEVDGKTYSDKKQGDTFTTPWGQIEVLSINVDAQTVTIMHGDQTLTLRAGQVVVK